MVPSWSMIPNLLSSPAYSYLFLLTPSPVVVIPAIFPSCIKVPTSSFAFYLGSENYYNFQVNQSSP